MTDRFHALLAGDVAPLSRWLKSAGWRDGIQLVAVIVIGSGVYGATMGLWRDPLQALYTAIKFPAMVLLTCGGNSAFNGCLASLLGSGLGFHQTTFAILMSFAVMPIILAVFWATAATFGLRFLAQSASHASISHLRLGAWMSFTFWSPCK